MNLHRRRRRIAITLMVVLALLFQGAFAVACDVHDLAHGVDAARAIDHHDDGGSSADGESADWHGLFQAGHGCLQVFGPVSALATGFIVAVAAHPSDAAARAEPSAPPGTLLRPPIDA